MKHSLVVGTGQKKNCSYLDGRIHQKSITSHKHCQNYLLKHRQQQASQNPQIPECTGERGTGSDLLSYQSRQQEVIDHPCLSPCSAWFLEQTSCQMCTHPADLLPRTSHQKLPDFQWLCLIFLSSAITRSAGSFRSSVVCREVHAGLQRVGMSCASKASRGIKNYQGGGSCLVPTGGVSAKRGAVCTTQTHHMVFAQKWLGWAINTSLIRDERQI